MVAQWNGTPVILVNHSDTSVFDEYPKVPVYLTAREMALLSILAVRGITGLIEDQPNDPSDQLDFTGYFNVTDKFTNMAMAYAEKAIKKL
jgi:hypothetical protein